MRLRAHRKLGHCPARMRRKIDVALAQQALSGALRRPGLKTGLVQGVQRPIYCRLALHARFASACSGFSPQCCQRNDPISMNRLPHSVQHCSGYRIDHAEAADDCAGDGRRASASAGRSSRILQRTALPSPIHCNRSPRRPKRLSPTSAQPAAAPAVVEADLTDIARPSTASIGERPTAALGPTRPAGQQRLAVQGRQPRQISTGPSGTGISPSMSKAPVDAGARVSPNRCRRRRGTDRQHHRPARLVADAALFFLHAVEVGAVDGDARRWRRRWRRASASTRSVPARPCRTTRQDAGGFRRAGRRVLILKRGPALDGIRRDDPLSLGDAVGHRPDDRARRRPASCLADAGCDRDGGMSSDDDPASRPTADNLDDDIAGDDAGTSSRTTRSSRPRPRRAGPEPAVHRHRLDRASRRRRRQGRRRGHPDAGQAAAQRARRLPHDERGRRRALCRQGAQPEEARHQLCAGPLPHQPHRPDGARDGDDGIRRHPHRDRGAAARSQSYQALAAALQRAAARRQVVSLYPDHRRPSRRPASSSIAARARARATISAPSPRPARSAAPSIRCSARSCSAPAPIRSSRAARGPACSTRSSAAPAPARARSRRRTMPNWCRRRRTSSPAAARR